MIRALETNLLKINNAFRPAHVKKNLVMSS